MKRFVQAFAFCLIFNIANVALAQTPVPMASQPGLTYTEDFIDIANWTNNFATGVGANRFSAVAVGGSTTIPSATKITTSTSTFSISGTGGVQRGSDQTPSTSSILLLSTGATSENSSSTAIDLFMDFTGVNAGTISFDWATVFNSTGNRNGSLRIYASIDGINFDSLTSAYVLNFTNNIAASGSITNISLPTSFNNAATARLRFYYHNGVGGTTGSRPKISIDNLTITALSNTPCITPTAQPSNLTFGTITSTSIAGSFTAASPSPNGYLVVISNNSSLASLPVDGATYNLGDNIGDGYVVGSGSSLNFTATALSPLTTYYFFIFSVNNICTGSIKYLTAGPLMGNTTTAAGLPPCGTPSAQPTGLIFGTTTVNTIQCSFTPATSDGYLVLCGTSTTLGATPVNALLYSAGDIIGSATVVQLSNLTTFTASGLSPNTLYYFFIFSVNSSNCTGGPVYYTTNPLTDFKTTQSLSLCTTPIAQPAGLSLSPSNNAISGSFFAGLNADSYIVIKSTIPSLSATPVNNTDYNIGDNIGGGVVVSNNSSTSFVASNLISNTTYYFFVFAANKICSGGSKYLILNPLSGNSTTSNAPVNNVYFGNIHSHSDYSDGNKDNPGYTPYDDYLYAMVSQCMDFLGISEHNHYTAGTKLSNFRLGVTQANNFNSLYTSFTALYGMEWGVISGGGHVLVYGDGMDNLWGWETNVGGVSGNNYDTYITKNDYAGASGLFKNINDNVASNTFGSLAHPNSSDFNNLANITYNAVADNAIIATTVESGPATSTTTNYTNPASPMSYLSYYQKLLSLGYHLGPTIDHDNHNTTFGRTTYSRTGIIAPALTKTEIIKAYRNMHFYATQDCDTKVDFTINTRIMGSIFTDHNAPAISVNLTDATTSISAANIRVMYGIPGSGINAIKIFESIGISLNYIDNNLANLATGYYYIDILNGSSRIITSPVWYTRNDNVPLPVTFSSFNVLKTDKSVNLMWSTEQESNSSHFIIERSPDGRIWSNITSIAAAGYSSHHVDYYAYDNLPLNGTGYYRIKQVDKDGRFLTSVVRNIHFDLGYTISVTPNPAKDLITILLDKNNSTNSLIQFFNTAGNLIFTEKTNQSKVMINTARFTRGLYFIKITTADNVASQKLLLQ